MTSVPLTQGTQLSEMQQRFQSIQDDPGSLLQYRNDTSIPEPLRRRAGERAYELLNNERQKAAAEQKFQEMIATGDNKGIANALQGRGSKGGLGDWVSLIALSYISPQMAGAKAEEMGIAPTRYETTTISNPDGTNTAVEIKKSASGKILQAFRMDGTPLTAKELDRLNAGAKLAEVGTDTFADPTGTVKGNWVLERKPGGSVYRQIGTNKIATEEQANALRKSGVQGTLADRRASLIQELNLKLKGKAGEEAMKIQRNTIRNCCW
jgi:hypothetical protein